MTDSWMMGRVTALHRAMPPEEEWATEPSGVGRAEESEQADGHLGPDVQQALQMLKLAQRTGEAHIATALSQAETIRADAGAAAEQLARDAQAQADAVRHEADKLLSDAQTRAAQIVQDAQTQADNARQDGDKIISDARAQAAEIAREAQASADGLKRQAQLRYEEMVGNLAAKRKALQQQIEALQEFDREYRARQVAFLQAQLRALWVEEPQVDAETEQPETVATIRHLPARHSDPEDNEDAATSAAQPS